MKTINNLTNGVMSTQNKVFIILMVAGIVATYVLNHLGIIHFNCN